MDPQNGWLNLTIKSCQLLTPTFTDSIGTPTVTLSPLPSQAPTLGAAIGGSQPIVQGGAEAPWGWMKIEAIKVSQSMGITG